MNKQLVKLYSIYWDCVDNYNAAARKYLLIDKRNAHARTLARDKCEQFRAQMNTAAAMIQGAA
jgi:hypothetical protein